MLQNYLTRRRFIKTSTLAASGILVAGPLRSAAPRRGSAGEKLNVGIIGAGGKGEENIRGLSSENIIAVCDVDENRAGASLKKLSEAKRYKDFRKMLETEKTLDAVVVTTPDHIHAPAAVMAMKLGKHVYCEKPLTPTIYEARVMRETAAKQKNATQMGNQGPSYDSTRRVVEIVQAGALGAVAEVHVWTDRPIWPQGIERPTETVEGPPTLDWDLWLRPAPKRPLHTAYVAFDLRG